MIWTAPSEKDTDNAALERRLWDAADQFRANSGLKSQEYSAPVLGLIFLRFAEVRFANQRAKLEKAGAKGGNGHSPRRGSRVDDPTGEEARAKIEEVFGGAHAPSRSTPAATWAWPPAKP
jgi:type I restriction enzyme M protein